MAEKKSKLAVIKTKENDSNVADFLDNIKNETQRRDSFAILKLMQKATKQKPRMWGSSMIGFGKKIYKSPASGREVEWFEIGFSPRKANLSLHLILDFRKHDTTLKKLGKHKTGAGCLYINKLDDIDIKVLEKLIKEAVRIKPHITTHEYK